MGGSRIESSAAKRRIESLGGAGIGQGFAVLGDEQMVTVPDERASPDEVTLQPRLGGLMQRDQAALAELRLLDHQSIRCEVGKRESERFAYPQACAGEQGEQGYIRVGSQ